MAPAATVLTGAAVAGAAVRGGCVELEPGGGECGGGQSEPVVKKADNLDVTGDVTGDVVGTDSELCGPDFCAGGSLGAAGLGLVVGGPGLGPGAGWARDGAGRIGGFERCEVEDGSGAADAREGLGLGSLGRWSPLPW